MNGKRSLPVLAVHLDGEATYFENMGKACEHFNMTRETLIGYLISGEELDDVQFQWAVDCDDDARFACLVAYFLRIFDKSDRARSYKEAKRAAQQSM